MNWEEEHRGATMDQKSRRSDDTNIQQILGLQPVSRLAAADNSGSKCSSSKYVWKGICKRLTKVKELTLVRLPGPRCICLTAEYLQRRRPRFRLDGMGAPRRYRVTSGKAVSLFKQWLSADEAKPAARIAAPSIARRPSTPLAGPVSTYPVPPSGSPGRCSSDGGKEISAPAPAAADTFGDFVGSIVFRRFRNGLSTQ
jgi:hypothetical protein